MHVCIIFVLGTQGLSEPAGKGLAEKDARFIRGRVEWLRRVFLEIADRDGYHNTRWIADGVVIMAVFSHRELPNG